MVRRGWGIAGRETVGDFRTLRFGDQVASVADDLKDHFWREDARVVAVSLGAYLFLHAQAQLPAFPGRVLLLSPIVGEATDIASGLSFVPPLAERLRQRVDAGEFAAPASCHIHVGSMDWQSNPEEVKTLAQRTGIAVTVVEGAGHQLGKDYVSRVLDAWLAE